MPGARVQTQSRRRITTLMEFPQAIQAMRSDVTLTALDVSGVGLQPDQAAMLAAALRGNDFLAHLELGRNPALGDPGVRHLAGAVHESSLISLGLEATGLGDVGGCVLAAALRRGCSLTSLRLQHNALGDKTANELASALRSAGDAGTTQLEQLQLQRNRISDSGAKALQAGYHKSTVRWVCCAAQPVLAIPWSQW